MRPTVPGAPTWSLVSAGHLRSHTEDKGKKISAGSRWSVRVNRFWCGDMWMAPRWGRLCALKERQQPGTVLIRGNKCAGRAPESTSNTAAERKNTTTLWKHLFLDTQCLDFTILAKCVWNCPIKSIPPLRMLFIMTTRALPGVTRAVSVTTALSGVVTAAGSGGFPSRLTRP